MLARAASAPRVAALVVALAPAPAGRFNPALAAVGGRPLYAWSVDRLVAAPAISATHVLLPRRAVPRFRREAAAAGWRGVLPLAVRPPVEWPAALLAALGALDGAIERILLHDAAYPLLDGAALAAVLVAAASSDRLAIAATPVQDTLKQVDAHGLVTGTPPRDRLWQARSPILAPRALLEPRLRALARVTPAATSPATGWLRALCAGLPARLVSLGADAPHVRTRADALALAAALGDHAAHAQPRP